jgi:hypothetical protein
LATIYNEEKKSMQGENYRGKVWGNLYVEIDEKS